MLAVVSVENRHCRHQRIGENFAAVWGVSAINKRVQKMHDLMEPACNPLDGDSSLLRRIDGQLRSPKLATRYLAAERCLEHTEPYSEVVFLNDLAPTMRQARYIYMQEFSLPFAVEMYSYNSGGNKGTLWWAWRAPPDPADSDNSRTAKMIAATNSNLPIYHSRAMRKEFIQRCYAQRSVQPPALERRTSHNPPSSFK